MIVSTRVLSVLSILAALIVGAILCLQVLEHRYYQAEPSVWAQTR